MHLARLIDIKIKGRFCYGNYRPNRNEKTNQFIRDRACDFTMRFCCYIVVCIVVCIDLLYVYNRTILIRNPCVIFSKKSVKH